jgi:hypothetical protein
VFPSPPSDSSANRAADLQPIGRQTGTAAKIFRSFIKPILSDTERGDSPPY